MPGLIAALDIGGTKIAAALVDAEGRVVDRAQAPTPGRDGAEAVLGTAAALVDGLLAGADETRERPDALGVATAGVVDPATGVITGSTDVLAGWIGTDVRGELAARLGLPVAVANDAQVHALGEARHGAGAGYDSVLHVAVGTGIGAGFVYAGLPGGLLVGAHAIAGHAGHVPSAAAADLECPCGSRGHLEAIASGPALVREFGRRTGIRAGDLRNVAARAADGDEMAQEVIELGGAAVGEAVGGLVNMLDPHLVVIGGGVAELGDPWWQPLHRALAATLLPQLGSTPVVPSGLGGDAALLGAASLAREIVPTTEEHP